MSGYVQAVDTTVLERVVLIAFASIGQLTPYYIVDWRICNKSAAHVGTRLGKDLHLLQLPSRQYALAYGAARGSFVLYEDCNIHRRNMD